MSEEQRRPEFIPLAYDAEGRVVDIMGNVRNAEAIPYGLDIVHINVREDALAFDICKAVLYVFAKEYKGPVKKLLKKDLEGRLGFICGPNTGNYIESDDGTWITVQLYRIKD
ncbi:MAG: hypothetical protein Q8P79_02270 [Nanoarchaeota archaeon]|nr:hypothetical protein [Nanoarchaeota archaeon]